MQKKMKAKAPVPSFRPLETLPTADDLASLESLMASPSEVEKQYAHEIEYRNKLVLAPMVRSGTLPVRLLSLYYGAGLVWTPEIVDKAIIGAERIVDREFCGRRGRDARGIEIGRA
jgi:tRNA-dihydrouridine synthase 2